ncbi:MAG: glutathione S-transferase family protein [Lysobacteraceae bacterium]|jgi:glutathione S-transferase|nr:glutathione S-transferase family protein [Silanimonas sp.]
MRLHIANKNYSSWSLRPWLVLVERGRPFEEVMHPFAVDNHATFSVFSPTGRVPCLHDGDRVVWDSLAIAEYLAERDPGAWPADRDARAFARCAAAEMHSGFGELRRQCSMNVGLRVRLHAIDAGLRADLDRLDALWQEGLRRYGGPFLAGEHFSIADAFFAPVAFRVQTYGLPLPDASLAYAARLRDLPGCRRWEREALAEPWRDPPHDAAILAFGTVTADLRAPA